jgi:hypothetical protein
MRHVACFNMSPSWRKIEKNLEEKLEKSFNSPVLSLVVLMLCCHSAEVTAEHCITRMWEVFRSQQPVCNYDNLLPHLKTSL